MKLLVSLLLPQLAGLVGSYFAIKEIPAWYMSLNKPSFTPPDWLFGPVWVTLYLLMGIALYLNWIKNTKEAKFNVKLFFVHLFFNSIWVSVFFGFKDIFLALEIIIFLWVAYASLLNYFLWKLN